MGELIQFISKLEDETGKSIIRLILFFFWIGVANYLLHIAWIWVWERLLNLKRAQDYFKTNQVPANVSDLSTEFRKAKIFRWSIVYRRISDLVQIKQNRGQIDNDALADILTGEASRKASFSNYILGILIILGLVGTLRGLITAIIEVQPLLQDIQDLDQLPTISDALRLTLSGMGTAFATTLVGLLTSLALGFCGWLFNREHSSFLTKFERFISTEIIPHLTQTPESSIESAASQLVKYTDTLKFATQENVGAMRQVVQQLADTSWDRQLEQQYILANKFDATAESLLTGLTDINEGLTDISGNQDSIESTIGSFKELMVESMSQIKEYQETLLQGLEDSVPKLEEESDALRTAIEEYQNSQSKFIDDLSSTLQSQLQSITGNQQSMVNVLTRLADELQIRSVLEAQNQIFERIETQLTENQKEMVLVLSQSVLEAQNKIFERIKTQLTENQQEIVSVLTQLADELQIRSAIERQNQIFERIETELTENQKEMILILNQSVLEAQNKNFERIKTELTNSQQAVVGVLTQLADELQIRSVLERQNQVFGRIEMHLEGQHDLVNEQRRLMETLDSNVNRLQQTFSKSVSDEQGRTEKMLQQLTQNFLELSEKMDKLNHTMSQPGLYRWGSEIRRWFGIFRK